PTVATNPVHAISEDYPLILNTGRIRDQWHTMTRTGLSAILLIAASHVVTVRCGLRPNIG
ncbi:hypothetical protein CKK01_08960, partial [Acinetobacter baumannii]|nr:hypothetical protein [Acinetobacter baumannii]